MWIKFADKMPPIGVTILAFNGHRIHLAYRWDETSNELSSIICRCHTTNDCNKAPKDTHWMKLPLMPTK